MPKRLYTRRGDSGWTTLADGTIVAKTDARIEAAGELDELNAHLGALIADIESDSDRAFLELIQTKIFAIGAVITGCKAGAMRRIADADIDTLEHEIDRIDHTLQPTNSFIMPRGNRQTALCHVCRTVCRRAERRLWAIDDIENEAKKELAYINRLSDYLFVLARKANLTDADNEKIITISCD